MKFKKVLPDPILREFIRFYWFLEGNAENPSFRKIMPFGALDLIIHRGLPMVIEKKGRHVNEPLAFVEGQYLNYHEKMPSANTDIVGVSIQPWASKVLFGIPSVEFTGQIVDVRNLSGGYGELICLIHKERGLQNLSKRLDEFFLRKFVHDSYNEYAHLKLFASVLMKFNELQIEEVADKFWGNSFRGLQIQFKETFGITLSEFRRKKRLQSAVQLMNNCDHRLTDTALNVGFYDQAHFTKAFKQFSGLSPRAYLKQSNSVSETMMGELFS